MGKERTPIEIKLSSDNELNELLHANIELIGKPAVERLAKVMARFNGPVQIHQEDGSIVVEKNWDWKLMLKEIPPYFYSASKVGLNPEQIEDLLIHSLNATPYDFHRVEIDVSLLTKMFESESQRNQKLTQPDLDDIKKMLTLCGKYGVLPGSVYSLTIARRIGLSFKDATKLIMQLPEADDHLAGYSLPHFFEALIPLSIAKVDPKIVKQVFELAGGKRPYYSGSQYGALEEILVFGGPSMELTSEEILKRLLSRRKKGEDFGKTIQRFIQENQLEPYDKKGVVVANPKQLIEKYFIDKSGELELQGLPYRTKRSLKDGIQDLQKIALHSSHRWESVGEGYWAYDPKTQTWYSMGGKLEVGLRKVRHKFIPFDVSTLSNTPYLLHVHPKELEIFLVNPAEDYPDREHRDHYMKFLAATPSRADYSVVADLMEMATSNVPTRSFIVHSLGITEFTYPTDLEKIKEMAIKSRDIRDEMTLNFDWQDAIANDILDQIKESLKNGKKKIGVKTMDKTKLVKLLIEALNKTLPEGFELKFHPHETFKI